MTVRSLFLTVALALICGMQVTPGVGMGVALAQSADPCMSATTAVITCQTRENAWNRCKIKSDAVKAAHPTWTPTCYYHSTSGGNYQCYISTDFGTGCGGYGGIAGGSSGIFWAATCAAGSTWQDSTKTCFSAAACLAKPAQALGILNVSLVPSKSYCDGGCQFVAQGGTDSSMTTGGGQSLHVYTGGQYKPSGSACAAGEGQLPAAGSDPPQTCVTDSGSSTPVCIKASTGENCVKFQDGRQSCWKPFETGEKTDGAKLQVRNAGSLPTTPQTAPPAGDTFAQQGSPTTTTATNVDPKGATRSATMTTTNYATVGGANAGQQDQGEPGDGSGSPSSSGGDGDAGADSDNLEKIKSAVFGDGSDPNGDTTGMDATAGSVQSTTEYGADGFDQTGFGYSRTCPAPPSVTLYGHTFAFDSEGRFCDWMVVGGWFVLVVAGIASMYIAVGGSRR